MATYGDIYNFAMNVSVAGVTDVNNLVATNQKLKQSMAELTLMFKQGKITADQYKTTMGALKNQSKDFDRLGNSLGHGIGGGSSRAAQGMMQLTYIMDDMKFGARGLINNIAPLTTAMFGFGIAGAAAGAAGTVLAGVFAKQIDKALAYAGILDENLVKGMEKGKKGTEEYGESLKALDGVLQKTTESQRDFTKSFKDTNLEEKTLEAALRQIVALRSPLGGALDEAQQKVAKLKDRLDDLNSMAAGGADIGASWGVATKELERAQEAVGKIREEMTKLVGEQVEQLKKALELGGDEAERILEGMEAAADKGPELVESIKAVRKALNEVAKATILETLKEENEEYEIQQQRVRALEALKRQFQEQQQKRWDEEEKSRLDDQKLMFEGMAAEKAALDKAEDERRKRTMARQQEEARGKLDSNAQRVLQAFGPMMAGDVNQSLQAGVNRGQSMDQTVMNTLGAMIAKLERMGVESGAAAAAANQMIDEQAPGFRTMIDANNAQAAMVRDMLRNNEMMLQMFNASRGQAIGNREAIQRQRDMIARNSRFNRGNMLGTFRPF